MIARRLLVAVAMVWGFVACGADRPAADGSAASSERAAPSSTAMGVEEQAGREPPPPSGGRSTTTTTVGSSTVGSTSVGSTTVGPVGTEPTTKDGTAPSPSSASLTPPLGHYEYRVEGFRQHDGVSGSNRTPSGPIELLDVEAGDKSGATRAVSTRPDGSRTTLALETRGDELVLVSATDRDQSGQETTLRPEPAITLARRPYVVGDTWGHDWADRAVATSGHTEGTVLRKETITAGSRSVDTFVIRVVQRVEGPVQGTIETTSWIAANGVQWRIHTLADTRSPGVVSHTEKRADLTSAPTT